MVHVSYVLGAILYPLSDGLAFSTSLEARGRYWPHEGPRRNDRHRTLAPVYSSDSPPALWQSSCFSAIIRYLGHQQIYRFKWENIEYYAKFVTMPPKIDGRDGVHAQVQRERREHPTGARRGRVDAVHDEEERRIVRGAEELVYPPHLPLGARARRRGGRVGQPWRMLDHAQDVLHAQRRDEPVYYDDVLLRRALCPREGVDDPVFGAVPVEAEVEPLHQLERVLPEPLRMLGIQAFDLPCVAVRAGRSRDERLVLVL